MLVPSVIDRCRETSALGSMARAQDELRKLKHLPKAVETTDHLMVITTFVGSFPLCQVVMCMTLDTVDVPFLKRPFPLK